MSYYGRFPELAPERFWRFLELPDAWKQVETLSRGLRSLKTRKNFTEKAWGARKGRFESNQIY